jgi:hypothetical protein
LFPVLPPDPFARTAFGEEPARVALAVAEDVVHPAVAVNHGADLHISGALAFEVPIMPFPLDGQGIHDFTDRQARQDRRRLAKNFWQDQ